MWGRKMMRAGQNAVDFNPRNREGALLLIH